MSQRRPARRVRALLGVVMLLVAGCSLAPEATPDPEAEATAPAAASATPTSCSGWTCTLRGMVYARRAEAGNEVPGTQVRLSQISYCSPTAGAQETRTGPNGAFAFTVYLHDTDTFQFEAEHEGYEPARVALGGFDCLYCACPAVEIVLQPR